MNTNPHMTRANALICIVAVAAGTILSGGAESKSRVVNVSYHVSTDGLDLNRPADAGQLYSRLEHAAGIVCSHGNRVDLEPLAHPSDCYENVVGNAVRSINRPQLTMIYLRKHSVQDAMTRGIDVRLLAAAK